MFLELQRSQRVAALNKDDNYMYNSCINIVRKRLKGKNVKTGYSRFMRSNFAKTVKQSYVEQRAYRVAPKK